MTGRFIPTLSNRQVSLLQKTTSLGGVPGFILKVQPGKYGISKTYILKMAVNGKVRVFTLGSFDKMSLAEARSLAAEWREKIQKGIDPAAERKRELKKEKFHNEITVSELLHAYIETETARGRWSDEGRQSHKSKAEGWIKNHLTAEVADCPVRDLTPHMLAKAFSDKWIAMRSIPVKLLGEIKRSIDWGVAVEKIAPMQNPADMRGPLSHLLPHSSQRPPATHHPHLPPERIPDFFVKLVQSKCCASRALQFCILTASRLGNGLGAHWDQIDLEKAVFTIPRSEMKIKGLNFDRQTPLSPQLIDLLRSMPRMPVISVLPDYIFRDYAGVSNYPITETSLRNHLRRMSSAETAAGRLGWIDPNEYDNKGVNRIAVPHGLARASFETWALNARLFNHDTYEQWLVEACLDHYSPKYGGAYMRGYPLEDMRVIFDDWANFCFSKVK